MWCVLEFLLESIGRSMVYLRGVCDVLLVWVLVGGDVRHVQLDLLQSELLPQWSGVEGRFREGVGVGGYVLVGSSRHGPVLSPDMSL